MLFRETSLSDSSHEAMTWTVLLWLRDVVRAGHCHLTARQSHLIFPCGDASEINLDRNNTLDLA